MRDPWGIGGLRGEEEKPNIKQIVKKNGQKISKIGEIEKKNWKNQIFFTENGLKCIRNPTKHL